MSRDPRVTPIKGDVLRGVATDRTVLYVSGSIVGYHTFNPHPSGRHSYPGTSIIAVTQWRKWAKYADAIHLEPSRPTGGAE